jgi:hypothetical protein
VEDDDAVGEFEGLVLVVGDEQGGHFGFVVELAEPFAQGFAHFGVEGAEGLVEQQHLRADGQGTGERDALPLAAAELRGVAVAVAFEGDAAQQFGDGCGRCLRARDARGFFMTRRPKAMFSATVM